MSLELQTGRTYGAKREGMDKIDEQAAPFITNHHRTTITGRVALKKGPVARIR